MKIALHIGLISLMAGLSSSNVHAMDGKIKVPPMRRTSNDTTDKAKDLKLSPKPPSTSPRDKLLKIDDGYQKSPRLSSDKQSLKQ
jgi:hypothetical protein